MQNSEAFKEFVRCKAIEAVMTHRGVKKVTQAFLSSNAALISGLEPKLAERAIVRDEFRRNGSAVPASLKAKTEAEEIKVSRAEREAAAERNRRCMAQARVTKIMRKGRSRYRR